MTVLHALVVGAGSYPHLSRLAGGGRFNLRPLTSPYYSALRVAECLRVEMPSSSDMTLGSIQLLASHPTESSNLSPPTFSELSEAASRWIEACISDEDSVALIYFCGHGLYRNSHYFLCDDFGDPSDPDEWSRVVDIEQLRTQIKRFGVKKFVGFLDSCAQNPIYPDDDIKGRALISAKPPYLKSLVNSMYYAAIDGHLAPGNPNAPSDYSDAVVQSLRGLAAVNAAGAWQADSLSIATAICAVLKQKALGSTPSYVPHQDVCGVDPLFTYGKGSVSVRVEASTARASGEATKITMSRGSECAVSDFAADKPMWEVLCPGDWHVQIETQHGLAHSELVPVLSPTYCGIRCSL